jgi:hypothetical protein
MRTVIFVFALLLTGITLAQSPHSKKVTIELDNISLEKALAVLSISYGVDFSYSDDVVPTQELVNLSIQNEELSAALNKLLGRFNLDYKITSKRILIKKSGKVLAQTVRGSVRQAITNATLPGITVIVKNGKTQLGTSTDSLGNFRVLNVPVGRISIAASCVGFNSRVIENILLGTGKELVLDLELSESVTAMEEVVVTAKPQDLIPGGGVALTSSKSFTVEETKRYAGSLGDPARMVTAFPGVTAASDESNALIVRGNSPRGMLWRIEGIEVPNPNHFATEGASGGVVSVLSTNVIEGSDFITGAFPAQYGNALSGVFDISLRNGNNKKTEYSAQAGFLGVEASAEGPFSRARPSSYLVNYRYSSLAILDKLNYDLNDAGEYKDYQDISFKINHPTGRAGTFSLFGIGGKSRADKQVDNVFDERSSDVGVIGLTYKYNVNERSSIQGALSFSGTNITKDNEVSNLTAEPVRVEESYTKSYLRASFSGKKRLNSRYVLEGGLIYSLLDFDFYMRNRDPGNTPYQTIINFSERGSTSITQSYLFARQYFSPDWFAFYGVHFLHFALTRDQSLEPRAGIRWQPSENTSMSFAFGKHSRIENLQYYLGRDHQTGGNEVQINKSLGYTRANHVVLTLEHTFRSDHRVKIEPYFQQLYNAPIQLDPGTIYSSINEDTGFITDTLVNNGKGRNYGVELSLEKSFSDNFYYLLNTSLYESKFTVDEQPERNTSYNGNYSVHALAGKEFDVNRGRDRIGLNMKLTWAGGRPFLPIDLQKSIEQGKTVYAWEEAFEQRLPEYFRADFQVVYRKNNPNNSIEWRLDIQNITDHRNASFYYFDRDANAILLKKQIGFLPLLSFRIDF